MNQLQFKIYDYLGSIKAVTEEDSIVISLKSYLPYRVPPEIEFEPQTKGYIG